jgi:extracellular factor (EF) 3-hydroxypalmitic acid methyl ester biosynthesis protein
LANAIAQLSQTVKTVKEDTASFRHYEELTGAVGRSIRFRPERFSAETLFRSTQPTVSISGCEAKLIDASFSGLSFVAPKKRLLPLTMGSQHVVRLQTGEKIIFEGTCRVVREEANPFGNKVGVALEDGLFIPEDVQKKYAKILLERALTKGSSLDAALIPAEYRLLCDKVLLLLRYYRRHLNAYEKTPHSDAEKAEALAVAEAALIRQWEEIVLEANALIDVLATKPEAKLALKRYTEEMLTPEFLGAPFWWRSYYKPLGYPGDYRAMEYIYNNEALGDGLFDKLAHRMGMYMGQFVRERMHFAADMIAAIATAHPKKPLRITNVGCGIAVELETCARQGLFPAESVLTLVDQDMGAMNAAYRGVSQALQTLPDHNVTLNTLNTTFLKLFETDTLFAGLPPQDVVYSLGIMDYLSPKRARDFTTALYRHVSPGGTLLIANVRQATGKLEWAVSYIFDWDLVYRSQTEMLSLAADIPDAIVDISIDSTGHVYLMTLQRPL